MPRVHGDHAGAEVDAVDLPRDDGDDRERVGAEDLRRPHRREARVLRGARARDDVVDGLVGVDARAESHGPPLVGARQVACRGGGPRAYRSRQTLAGRSASWAPDSSPGCSARPPARSASTTVVLAAARRRRRDRRSRATWSSATRDGPRRARGARGALRRRHLRPRARRPRGARRARGRGHGRATLTRGRSSCAVDKAAQRRAFAASGPAGPQVRASSTATPTRTSPRFAAFAERSSAQVPVVKAARGGYDGRGVVVADDPRRRRSRPSRAWRAARRRGRRRGADRVPTPSSRRSSRADPVARRSSWRTVRDRPGRRRLPRGPRPRRASTTHTAASPRRARAPRRGAPSGSSACSPSSCSTTADGLARERGRPAAAQLGALDDRGRDDLAVREPPARGARPAARRDRRSTRRPSATVNVFGADDGAAARRARRRPRGADRQGAPLRQGAAARAASSGT